MVALHACIFAQYVDISGVILRWAEKCHAMLVVQHPADGTTKRIHCHVVMGGTQAKEDWYRERAKDIMGEFITRGNYWIAQKVQKGEHKGKPVDFHLTAVYAIKGKYAVVFNKNISPADVEQYQATWSESPLENASSDKCSDRDQFVTKVYHRFDNYHFVYEVDCIHDKHGDRLNHCESLFWEVKSMTMKQFFADFHKAPFPQYYKQVTSTVFMLICKRLNCEDQGIQVLLNSWY